MFVKFPIAIELDLTSRCNYRCRFCRNGYLPFSELDFNTIERIIAEAQQYKVFHLTISGGEPTLYPDFNKVISVLGGTNLTWNLVSNGSTLSEGLVRRLRENNLNSITITLSGMSADNDDFFKSIKGAFKKTLTAIDLCIKHHIKLYIGYLVTPRSYQELPLLIDFLSNYDILDDMVVIKLMKVKPWGAASFQKELFYMQHDLFIQAFNRIKNNSPYRVIGEEATQSVENIHCMAGELSCVVGSDAFVYPCVSFLGNPKFACGSVNSSSLRDIWNHSNALNHFRAPRSFAEKCNTCELRIKCTGGCRANAWYSYGDISMIDSDCKHV